MLNILPKEEKKKILTEYRLRLAAVSFFAIATLTFSSLILLVPSYLLAVLKYNNAAQELAGLETKTNIVTGQEKNVDTQITALNKKINLLLSGDTNRQLSPSQVIINILSIKGVMIKISGFTYEAIADQERVVLSGNAVNRDSLAQFVETLKKDPSFISVDLPISSYVKSTNIDFSIVVVRGTKGVAKK